MTTFDGASGDNHEAPLPQAQAWPSAADSGPESLLDQLRDRVEQRDESEPQEWFKEVPGLGVRLVCDPDIENEDFQRWMRQATPKVKGRARNGANPMSMDQLAMSARALTAQCLRLEIKRGEAWAPMLGQGGDTLTVESGELLRTFNVMDSTSLLRKLFGRDARVIDAGQELLAEAGYLGDDDAEDDDPA